MSFDLTIIALIVGVAILYLGLVRPAGRRWFLLVASLIALFWLQPRLPVRFGGYLLPAFLLVLIVVLWFAFIREREENVALADWVGLGVIAGVALIIAQSRYVSLPLAVYSVRPPGTPGLLLGLSLAAALVAGLSWWLRRGVSRQALSASILFVILLFVLWKSEPLATALSRFWRDVAGQDVSLASPLDLTWLGFSYVAFRLIHALREKQLGNLPAIALPDFVTYVIFFAALPAGPIDRAERFQSDLQRLDRLSPWDGARILKAFERIGAGLIKKFVIADSLALGLSLNPTNAAHIESTGGLWLLLYGYSLRLFFDFSGYSDIAIGLALLFGIQLPENFDRPYLQTNITTFWQRWHMTLSNWVRYYVFSPLSRALLRRKPRPSPTLIVLIAQLTTMIVIGLWHGISWNFLIWGLWHGLGLFIHKQWSDRTRKWYRHLQQQGWQMQVWRYATWFLTFHFVVVGWVWFLIPDTRLALATLARLFGFEVAS